ncbi:MAG: DUF4160 domain-containing protein [Segatella maculosa]
MDYYLMYIADYNPPHFHVWYDNYKATMTITDGIITGSLPRRAIKWCMNGLICTKMN